MEENKAHKEIELELNKLQQPDNMNQNLEIESGEAKSTGINAVIKLCEVKTKEIGEKDKLIEKLKLENQKTMKSNKEYKEDLKKKEIKQKQLEADNEQLIKEKCSVSKQALILEENNRSLRSIVSYLELEDSARNTDGDDNERNTTLKPEVNKRKQRTPKKRNSGDETDTESRNKDKDGRDRNRYETKDEHRNHRTRREGEREEKEQAICWFYENAYCNFGEKCRYKHRSDGEIKEDHMAEGRQGVKGKINKEQRKMNPKARATEFCWWDETGTCNYGNMCENPHREREENKNNKKKEDRTRKYCWWDENDICDYGERCYNLHRNENENVRRKKLDERKSQHSLKEKEKTPREEGSRNNRSSTRRENLKRSEDMEEGKDKSGEYNEDTNSEKRKDNESFLGKKVTQDKRLYKEVLRSPWL